jgi:hypothetical protein
MSEEGSSRTSDRALANSRSNTSCGTLRSLDKNLKRCEDGRLDIHDPVIFCVEKYDGVLIPIYCWIMVPILVGFNIQHHAGSKGSQWRGTQCAKSLLRSVLSGFSMYGKLHCCSKAFPMLTHCVMKGIIYIDSHCILLA